MTERSGVPRRSDDVTLGRLAEAVEEIRRREERRLRILLGFITVVGIVMGLVWRAVENINTDHNTLVVSVAHQTEQDNNSAFVATAMIATCVNAENASLMLHDTLPAPNYAARAFALVPTCGVLQVELAKRYDGRMP